MGYATAASPVEGFAKSSLNPVLAETEDVLSPGGGSVVAGPGGESWLVYHGRTGAYTEPRTMRIDPVYWSGESVSTPGPTTGPQTFPPDEPRAPPDPQLTRQPPPSEPPPAEPAEVTPPADLTVPAFGFRVRRSAARGAHRRPPRERGPLADGQGSGANRGLAQNGAPHGDQGQVHRLR